MRSAASTTADQEVVSSNSRRDSLALTLLKIDCNAKIEKIINGEILFHFPHALASVWLNFPLDTGAVPSIFRKILTVHCTVM